MSPSFLLLGALLFPAVVLPTAAGPSRESRACTADGAVVPAARDRAESRQVAATATPPPAPVPAPAEPRKRTARPARPEYLFL